MGAGTRKTELGAHMSRTLSTVMMIFAWSFPYKAAAFLVFWIYVSAEFSYLVSWSLAAELAPGDQLSMFAAYGATQATGRMLGAVVANPLWHYGRFSSLASVSV